MQCGALASSQSQRTGRSNAELLVPLFFNKGRRIPMFDPASEFADVAEWIATGPKPFFLGFGSMVIKDTNAISEMIKKAVVRADCRMIVQSSWSKIDVSGEPRCMFNCIVTPLYVMLCRLILCTLNLICRLKCRALSS